MVLNLTHAGFEMLTAGTLVCIQVPLGLALPKQTEMKQTRNHKVQNSVKKTEAEAKKNVCCILLHTTPHLSRTPILGFPLEVSSSLHKYP